MRRALLIGAGVLALLVATFFVAVPIVISRNLSADRVAERGAAIVGRPVSVGSVRLTFRPGLRIRAEAVSIEGGGSAEVVDVQIAVLPLLRGRVEPSKLHLRGARILVDRGADGGLRLRLFHLSGRETKEGRAGFPALPALEVRDSEIVMIEADGTPADARALEILGLEFDRLSSEGRTPVRLDVALEPSRPGGPAVGELRSEGFIVLEEGEARIHSGRVRGRDLVWHGLRFPRFAGSFDYAGGRVGVEELELAGYDGAARFTGVLRIGQPVRFEGDIAWSELALSGLVGDWRGGQPVGNELGSLDAAGTVALALRRADRGTGRGELSIEGGALPAGSLFSSLLGTLGRLTGSIIPLGRSGPSPSAVESVTAEWELRGDRLHTQNLAIVTEDYRYTAAGSLGLDQTLDFAGTLQLTSRGAQRMVASAALPLPAATAVIPEIPLRVGGRLDAPSFTASVTALPGVAKSALSGLVRGGESAVEGAARAGKGALDKVLGR